MIKIVMKKWTIVLPLASIGETSQISQSSAKEAEKQIVFDLFFMT